MNPRHQKTIQDRQSLDKETVIKQLREMPIKEVAVKKAGIGRATFYRWCEDDPEFLAKSEQAIKEGTDYINDMGESQVIVLTRDKHWPAIRYWLEHNHPKYMQKNARISMTKSGDNFEVIIPYNQTQ